MTAGPVLTVVRAGPLTTVQDEGRPGLARYGICRAGAVDLPALHRANRRVGNPPGAAGLEATLIGPTLRAERDCVVALAGGRTEPRIDGVPVDPSLALHLTAGATLRVGPVRGGARAYLAVRGGLDPPPVLGSRSTDTLGRLGPPPLADGDLLVAGPDPTPGGGDPPGPDPEVGDPDVADPSRPLLVDPGPRADWLVADALTALAAVTWTVLPASDRTAVRLDGPPLRRAAGPPGSCRRRGWSPARCRSRRTVGRWSSWPTTRRPAGTPCWPSSVRRTCPGRRRPGRAARCGSPSPRPHAAPGTAATADRASRSGHRITRTAQAGPGVAPTYPPGRHASLGGPTPCPRCLDVPVLLTPAVPATPSRAPDARRRRVAAGVVLTATLALLAGLLAPLAAPAAAATAIEGIDISRYQHPNGAAIDFDRVAASGKRFALIQATKGSAPSNDWFPSDWAAAGRAGMIRGAYHYAVPRLPVSTAASDARTFVARVGSFAGPGVLPPLFDLEVSNGLTPEQMRAWAQTWLDTAEELTGRRPMIYTYRYFWQHDMADTTAFRDYPLWIANYVSGSSPTLPLVGGWRSWAVWQYSDRGRVPGIVGDVDLNRFCCDAAALDRLAGGAAGPPSSNPFGALDGLHRLPGAIAVGGYAVDPDTSDPIDVHVYLDGAYATAGRAADGAGTASARTTTGGDRRYTLPVRVGTAGRHTVCAYGINAGPGTANSLLGCSTFTLPTTPGGSLDVVAAEPGAVRVRGWVVDPDTAAPTAVHVYVDGRLTGVLPASASRPDVAAARPGYGALHGYDGVVRVGAGAHTVCAYAIDVAPGGINPRLGCAPVTTAASTVLGSLDTVERTGDGARVAGWALDTGTTSATAVVVTVDGAYAGTLSVNASRPDVGRAHPGAGDRRGYDGRVPVPAGPGHVLCTWSGRGSGDRLVPLGCTVT